MILPDTSSFKLDNLVGTDPAGYAGLEDGVDWHWDRIFAGAALTTLLGIGAELAAPENRQDGNRVVIAGRDSVQDSVNQIGQEMTRRNMSIQPTLTERPGCRCGSSSTATWCCGPTSPCSSSGRMSNELNLETSPGTASSAGSGQVDLRVPS